VSQGLQQRGEYSWYVLDRLRFRLTDAFVRLDQWLRKPHWWEAFFD
jgi:hypothetical protein